jgi:ABC-type amino acid transport system permease subunit
VDTSFVRSQPAVRTRGQTLRAYVVSLVGPTTAAAGLIWAILQPYRVTLLHPRSESFWWLVAEPPLLVMLVGAVFAIFVARPLIADLEERDATAR